MVFTLAQLGFVGGLLVSTLADATGDQLALGVFGAIPTVLLSLLLVFGWKTLGRMGRETAEVIGVVTGNTVRAKHVGRDIMAGLKTIVGGEIRGYTEMLSEARDQALRRMVEAAGRQGADAVVNVRFTTAMVMQGMSEMLAYGTAVKLK